MAITVERIVLAREYGANCYLVRAAGEAAELAVVDPGGDPAPLLEELAATGRTVAGILVTHADIDHIGGVAALAAATGAQVWIPAGEADFLRRGETRGPREVDAYEPEHLVADGDSVTMAGLTFDVVGVPGHSVDHVAFCAGDQLFAGDLLFAGSVGRVDFEGGDWETLLASVRRLLDRYGPDAVVYPGHGDPTTLGRELDTNPFLGELADRRLMAERFQAPRGTHDVLPADGLWWHVVRTMEEQAALYGWRRIQTPGFEDTGLFARTAGEASDVVHKEMYTFSDRSDRSLTLRPEGTAPVARAYIEHGLYRAPQPVKAYTIAPMYRYGAPGRGRYREHWQLSLEALGSPGPEIDAEVLQFYVELLGRLGVTDWELHLNSIGDAECRPAYVARLNEWLDAHVDALDEDARHKRATSPLQVFDVKNPALRAALDEAPKIGESLCDACQAHFDAVRRLLDAVGVPYVVDSTLVRGLDYYTRTTFEFIGPEENVNSTICGGGRYDGLVEAIGGPATPGIGFGAGIERLQLAIEREGAAFEARPIDVFFAVDGVDRGRLLELMSVLRRRGVACDTDYASRSLKGQRTQYERSGAATLVVAMAETATVSPRGGPDRTVALADLLDTLSP